MHYAPWFQQFSKMLTGLEQQLTKAEAFANERKFDANTLLQARLAPDQFPLVQQVQVACDNVKLAAARLAQKTAPKHADNETSIAELRARIASTQAFLETLQPEDFAGAEAVEVRFPWLPGMHLFGPAYFLEFAVPNIYFHLTTAYAILRHNGVPLGKQDYIVSMPVFPDASSAE